MLMGTRKPMIGTKLNRTHPLAKGFVGCWLFNEGVGNKAYDLSGCGNHGTLTGMAFPSTPASGRNPSKNGIGLAFDGTNDYVSVPASSALDTIANTLSLETWLKVDEYYSYGCHLSSPGIKWEQSSGGNFGITLRSGATEIGETWITGDPASVWQHLAVTWDGSVIRFYKNGVELDNVTTSGDTISTGDIIIGRMYGAGRHFKGVIDEVKIYNGALSAADLKRLYHASYAMFEQGELIL